VYFPVGTYDVRALVVPAQADRREDRVGQAGAGIGVDFSPLYAVVGGRREKERETVEASQNLLGGDLAVAHAEKRGREVGIEGELVTVAILDGVRVVDIEHGRDDVASGRRLRPGLEPHASLDMLRDQLPSRFARVDADHNQHERSRHDVTECVSDHVSLLAARVSPDLPQAGCRRPRHIVAPPVHPPR
jgi:hypothetical protein